MLKKAILASSNRHKLEEIKAILDGFDYDLYTMADVGLGDMEIVEDGETFEANSLIKAKAVFELKGTTTIADDSGLEVDYLNGAPGVLSARYAGDQVSYSANNKKLLEALNGVPKEKRSARFVTVITMLLESGEKIVARGEVNGYIGTELKGDQGFGYDPLFIVPSLGKTFAQLSSDEKNSLSHRANALVVLKEKLEKLK